ncbi:MAG: multiple antibiotic resistance protein [Flavobacteriales bacterium]|jgi:multiple antibiotic resistance protein
MQFSTTEILKVSVILFAVIDIIGSLPIIIDVKQKAGQINSLKATLVSFSIMTMFLLVGEPLIGIFGIGVAEFAVAGALVLFFIALEMILGVNLFKQGASMSKTASIVPIAFPLIAGAGSMTTIISLRAEFEMVNIFIAIAINLFIVYLVLRNSHRLEKLLGDGGIAILQKVFGVILLAIAVKLFTSNLQEIFQ